MAEALFRGVDCVRLYVADLEAGLDFYCGQLGHDLIWRMPRSAGLRIPGGDSELVLQTDDQGLEIDFLVDSADAAAAGFVGAGGRVEGAPFDIPVGRAVVVQDPWGNRYVLLDMSKGRLATDAEGNVIG